MIETYYEKARKIANKKMKKMPHMSKYAVMAYTIYKLSKKNVLRAKDIELVKQYLDSAIDEFFPPIF